MTVELRPMTREAADALLAGESPPDVRVADDHPTEFSAGVARAVGIPGLGPFFIHRADDDVVVGEIGGAFVDEDGTLEIGYAIVGSQGGRGFATAAVEALIGRARATDEVHRIVAHTPLDRPASARVLEKTGFTSAGEVDDTDEDGTVRRVHAWELTVR